MNSPHEEKLERFGDDFNNDSSKKKKKKKSKKRDKSKKKKKKKEKKRKTSSRSGKSRSQRKRNGRTRSKTPNAVESRKSRSRSNQRFSGEREMRPRSQEKAEKRNFESKHHREARVQEDTAKALPTKVSPARKSESDRGKRKPEDLKASQERVLKRRKISPPKTQKLDLEPKRTVTMRESKSPSTKKPRNSGRRSPVSRSPSPEKSNAPSVGGTPSPQKKEVSNQAENRPKKKPLDPKASPVKMVLTKTRPALKKNPLKSVTRWKDKIVDAGKEGKKKHVKNDKPQAILQEPKRDPKEVTAKLMRETNHHMSSKSAIYAIKDARTDVYPKTESFAPAARHAPSNREYDRSRRFRRDEERSRRGKRKRRSYSRSEDRSPRRRRRRKRSPSSSESSSRSPSRDRRRKRSRSRTRGRRRRGRDRRSSYSPERSRRRKRKKRVRVPEWLSLAVEAFANECSGNTLSRLPREVRDFNQDYCRTLMQNIPFISEDMTTIAKLQLMGRLKGPYTQYYNLKFNPQGSVNALFSLMKNGTVANPTTAVYNQHLGLAGLKRPEEKLREENQKKQEKISAKKKSSSRSAASESESSESEEAEKVAKSEPDVKKEEKASKPVELKPPQSPSILPPPFKAKDSSKIDEELKLLTEKKKQMEEQERQKKVAIEVAENAAQVTTEAKKDTPQKVPPVVKVQSEPEKKTPPPVDDEESSSDDVLPSPMNPVISRIDDMLQKKRREQCERILAKHREDDDMEKSQRKLMSMNKLMLFLDVDHTLLHATKSPKAKQHMSNPILKQSIHEIEFPNPNNCPYYVKLRPGVESFLQTASEKYNIVLYTMGYKAYAEIVRRLMDPTGHYIRAIISREEHVNRRGEGGKKSIQEFIPLYDSNTVIIDDVTKVWEKPDNVLAVPRYSFWPENETLEIEEAWEGKILEKKEQDFTLRNISYLLGAVHQMWYTPPKPIFSAPRLLDALAKGVLANCELVFTGIIPQQTDPLENAVWKLAVKFGAKCSQTITQTTTHVIADRRITAKVQSGKRNSALSVVHVNWLYQSASQFVRADENYFEFRKPPPPMRAHSDKKLEISTLRDISDVDTLIQLCMNAKSLT